MASTDNIIPFTGTTTIEMPVDKVLDGAKAANLKSVLVLGFDENDNEMFFGSFSDGRPALWLIERFKTLMLK